MARGRRAKAAPAPPPEDHDASAEVDDDNDDVIAGEAERSSAAPNDDDDDDDDEGGGGGGGDADDDDPDASVLRILLSTDNHLGYLERDPIRGRDSFAAFEEVLYLARKHSVDMVLLSGDLFHENKPSRKTLHATMEILRRYCMGGGSVGFQIVSDQKDCLRNLVTGRANYEDEFYSVDLPVFTIHGNHDDPTRDGGPDLLSAVDLLAISNLVNYFGRQDEVDNVRVSPVLLRKGDTRVALYGMGSMRDERLNRMWQGKKVKFLRPADERGAGGVDDDRDDEEERRWFNIFTLHQNRDLGRGSKNCVHESMIPEWMDLVVWGHEHECLINPSESLVGTFRIVQPGSSVATSLTAGESRRKQVGLLEIKGQQFRLRPLTLTCVRGFAVGDVNLGDRAREHGGVLDVEDPKVEERMMEVLAAEVEALIQKARDEAEHMQQDAEDEAVRLRALEDEFDDPDKPQRKYMMKNPERVLVRLKVEHSGFTTLNNQRFGSQFVGQVANPSDILLFHKRRQAENAKGGKSGASRRKRNSVGLDVPVEPEDLEQINIEDLIVQNLANNDKKMELLDERSMGEALEQYVDKKEAKAIYQMAEKLLDMSQKTLMKRARGGENGEFGATLDNPTAVREVLSGITGKKRADYEVEREEAEEDQKKSGKKDKNGAGGDGAKKRANFKDDESVSDAEEEKRPTMKKPRVATTSKKTSAKSKAKYDDSDDDDFEDDDDDEPPPKKRAPAKKAASSKSIPGRYHDDSDVEFMDTESHAPTKPASSSSRAARTTAKKPKYNYDDDSDVEEIEDSEVEETPRPTARGKKPVASAGTAKARAPSQTQSTLTSFASMRKPSATSRGNSRVAQYLESDSDDEPSRGGGGWGSASQSTKGRSRR